MYQLESRFRRLMAYTRMPVEEICLNNCLDVKPLTVEIMIQLCRLIRKIKSVITNRGLINEALYNLVRGGEV